jgi:hypothetical protein
MLRDWVGTGPEFHLEWGGRTWSLNVCDTRPGLRVPTPSMGPLLGLEGVAKAGHWAPGALSGATLVGFELRGRRIEATYAPLGWGALFVRAGWSCEHHDAVDLEIQVHALSVGQLKALEVKVVSQLTQPPESRAYAPLFRWVEPRDAHAASLSYDGREPDLRGLTTLAPRESAFHSPRLVSPDEAGGWLYAEMVHPDDVSRRIREGGRTLALALTTRYGLFGHDIEKGVVLRARLRGLWLRSEQAKEVALARFEEFLEEPPPLKT